MLSQNINLTTNKKPVTPVVHMVQNDSGRKLVCTVYDYTSVASGALSVELPSGTVYTATGTISSSTDHITFSCDITNSMLAEVGKVKATVKLFNASSQLVSTHMLYIDVEESAGFNHPITPQNDKIYVVIDGQNIELAKQPQVDTLQTDVTNLKEDLTGISEKYGKNIYTNGDVYVNNIRQKVVLDTPLKQGTRYTLSAIVTSTDIDANSCAFDDGFNTRQIERGTGRTSVSFTPNGNVTSLTFYASDNYSHSVGDTASLKNIQIEVGSTATEYQFPLTAKDDYSRDKINGIIIDAEHEKSILLDEINFCQNEENNLLLEFDDIEIDYILNNDGTTSKSNGWVTTDYIPLTRKDVLLIKGKVNVFTIIRATYNDEKKLISYATMEASEGERRWDVPPNVRYVRYSFSKSLYNLGMSIRRIVELDGIYNGEKVVLPTHKYKARILFNPGEESGKSYQAFAVYNDILFQCLGNNAIATYDMLTGAKLNEFSADIGHGGSACFSNVKFSENDEFPLLYVAKGDGIETTDIYTHTVVLRVTRGSATTIRTYRFDTNVVGFGGANSCVDFENNIMYTVGYIRDIYNPTDNGLIVNAFDLNNSVANSDGTYTPELLWTREIPFIYVVQSINYIKGQIWLLSSDSSGNYDAKAYVYNIGKNEVVSTINFPDIVRYGEIEDLELTNDGVILHSRTQFLNYIIMMFS